MSLNSFVLCSLDDNCVKAYPDWTYSARNCTSDTVLTTCDGIKIHFDIDGFLDLGINFTPYIKQRLMEALREDGIYLNKVSRYCVSQLMDTDPLKLKRWECYEGFDPNYITINGTGNIVYAKGSSIDIILDCCIKITPTMWCCMNLTEREHAKMHPSFEACTSEWSSLFRSTY